MGAEGLIIYRLRGRYYSEYRFRDCEPRGLGREIINNIPADLDKFQEWKKAKVAFYLNVENRIRRLARDSPLRDFRDSSKWCYHGEPYCEYILRNASIEWIYAIDLDEDVLRVSGYNDQLIRRNRTQYWPENFRTKYFRLDNIPRWLFDLGDHVFDDNDGLGPAFVHPILLASRRKIPAEFWANHLRTPPEPDLELLELYKRCSPQPMSPRTQGRNISVWMSFQLLLLGEFFEHFIRSFQDIGAYGRKSTFVFHQLAYAIVCLAQWKCIQFLGHNPQDMIRILSMDCISPSWEPPDADTYWVGDVLIMLNEHIKHELNKHAAIGKAIQLASASKTSTDVMVILFSTSCIVLVKISPTTHGPEVSHSSTLPLFTTGMETSAFTREKYQTPGVMALLDLFSSRPYTPPAISHPGNLPAEICLQIFQLTDPVSQRALRRSCRLFHQVALDRPRIGEWTLLRYRGGHEFVAFSSLCGVRVVRVERMEPGIHRGGSAFKLGVWIGGEKVVFGIPLFRVDKRGYV